MNFLSVKRRNGGLRGVLWKIFLFFPLLLMPLVTGGKCSFFKPERNVILITVDTLRADRLGCYGSQTVDTPGMDALATQGVLFENAITPVPLTLPAHASILTGLYPEEHGIRCNGFFKLPQEAVTLAEVLREAGYNTAAFISSSVMNARFGLDQGFDSYEDLSMDSRVNRKFSLVLPADETNRRVLRWFDRKPEGPFFVWIHYFDPHADYNPPEPFRSMYEHPYDGEVAFVDSQIGALMKELEKRGLLKNTLTVLTSDHGEGLEEHGERFHGFFLYDTTMKVPLIFSGPGIPGGKRVASVVNLLDIAPTVLSCLGMSGEMKSSGRDLMKSMTKNKSLEAKPTYIETMAPKEMMGWSGLTGLRTTRYKFITAPARELYDLQNDPYETDNIYDSSREVVAELKKRMKGIRNRLSRISSRGSSALSPNGSARKNLEALGYVGSKAGERAGDVNMADRKEVLHYYYRARDLMKMGMVSLAVSAYARAEEIDPDNPAVLDELAYSLMKNGDLEAAERKYKKLLELDPKRSRSWKYLGMLYLKAKKFDEAAKAAGKALELDPDMVEAHFVLGVVAQEKGDIDKAVGHYEKELEINPEHYATAGKLGEILLSSPETRERGEELLQKARKAEENGSMNKHLGGTGR